MKKLIAILACSLVMMGCASAQTTATADISNLTPDQQAEVLKSIEKMKTPEEQAKNISATAREETEKWAELGGNMGKAAVGAAREIGMAANEFVSTPLGKVTMGVVIYKVVGRDILGVIVGTIVLLFFLGVSVALLRSKKYINVEYEYQPYLFGAWTRRVVKSGKVNEEWAVGYLLAAFISAAMGLVVGISCIL